MGARTGRAADDVGMQSEPLGYSGTDYSAQRTIELSAGRPCRCVAIVQLLGASNPAEIELVPQRRPDALVDVLVDESLDELLGEGQIGHHRVASGRRLLFAGCIGSVGDMTCRRIFKGGPRT